MRPRLEDWEGRFFSDSENRLGLALVNDMFSIVRHMAQNDKEEPSFFPFESREQHDLDWVANTFITDGLAPIAVRQSLRSEFVRDDRFWGSIYPSFQRFLDHYHACENRIIEALDHKSDPGSYRPTIFVRPELPPDREPSEELKEQVKSRDHFRCLCCGCVTNRLLQVDHVVPSYTGGTNHLDTLQTLCRTCNQATKATDNILFRNNQTFLTAAPSESPRLLPPTGQLAKEAEQWKLFLRRWVNFFYQCAAVDAVEVGERGERLRVWTIRLFPENDPAWLAIHIESLVRQIRETRQEAGYTPAPDRITVNEPPISKVIVESEVRGEAVTTLEEVLSKIADVEGFQAWISNSDGRKVRGDWTKEIQSDPYENALNGEVTVETWKNSRYLKNYPVFDSPDFQVEVIDGDGYVCAGQRKLKSVRESYSR